MSCKEDCLENIKGVKGALGENIRDLSGGPVLAKGLSPAGARLHCPRPAGRVWRVEGPSLRTGQKVPAVNEKGIVHARKRLRGIFVVLARNLKDTNIALSSPPFFGRVLGHPPSGLCLFLTFVPLLCHFFDCSCKKSNAFSVLPWPFFCVIFQGRS
jgi:hypothetical protein